MCTALEELKKEGKNEGKIEGKIEGRIEGKIEGKILARYEDGMTVEEIARKMGIPVKRVEEVLEENKMLDVK